MGKVHQCPDTHTQAHDCDPEQWILTFCLEAADFQKDALQRTVFM